MASSAAIPVPSLVDRVRLAATDIKLSHSVFAMPFALLGAFLARAPTEAWGSFAGKLGLVVVCMVLARTWAMLVNRIADARFDVANPRTAARAVASGRLPRGSAMALAAWCAGLFVLAAGGFWLAWGNVWPALLAAPVLAWLALYSFAKRFTSLCHVLLGTALAISPIAAAIAVRPESLGATPSLYWLAGMVALWVAGFDVIYALQDTEFDRSAGLFSIPSRLGVKPALWLSRAMHAGAATLLLLAARSDSRFGVLMLVGVGIVSLLLVYEHVHLARRGQAGLEMAFFTINGIVSCVVGALGVIDSLN
ncbi:MAG: 4-hydroxybenzoate octaprenyltransferase [Phycisphaerales bacterium]